MRGSCSLLTTYRRSERGLKGNLARIVTDCDRLEADAVVVLRGLRGVAGSVVVVLVLGRVPAAGGGLFSALLCRSVAPPGVTFGLEPFGG